MCFKWLWAYNRMKMVTITGKISQIEKLSGESNWLTWKFDINLNLSVNKLLPVVTGTETRPIPPGAGATAEITAEYQKQLLVYKEKDALASFIIGSSVDTKAKRLILSSKTSKEMWDTLHSVYQQKNERRLDLLYCQLFTYKKEESDDIAVHVAKLQILWEQVNEEIKDEGKLPESLLMNRVLNTLPAEYLR